MAADTVTDWDNVTAITREKSLPKIIDQITSEHPVLNKLLTQAETVSGGKRIEQTIKFVNATTGGSYSGAEVLDATETTTRTKAYWDWKQYYMPIVVSNIDRAKNKGAEGLFDIVKTGIEEAGTDLQQLMGGSTHGVYGDGTGNDSKDMEGLVAAVDDSTNVDSYGGIARSTYDWFASDYTASGGALSLSTMATTYDAVKSGTDIPSFIVTSEAIWSAYEATLQPQVRYAINSGQQKLDIEGGFQTLRYRSAGIVSDELINSGYMYMLNTKYLQFKILKHPDFKTDNLGFAMRDLRAPDSQDASVGFILWYGNLINTQPRRSGVIRGLS